jgi:ABC-type cobalamin/Fe3+-siderophores transport system ATPase subunit
VSQPSPTESAPAVVARGIAVRGTSGPVYGPLDLDIEQGGLTVLVAAPGVGRTALLLTLAGRMRPDRGDLTVLDRSSATAIFAAAALAGIDEVDAPADTVTVGDLVTEQLSWNARWYKRIRRADEADVARVCGRVFGDVPLPRTDDVVDELTELTRLLLRVALADTARRALLVVGDLDQVTDHGDRARLVERLVALGRDQTVVTASANPVDDLPAGGVVVALQITPDQITEE